MARHPREEARSSVFPQGLTDTQNNASASRHQFALGGPADDIRAANHHANISDLIGDGDTQRRSLFSCQGSVFQSFLYFIPDG